MKIYITVAQADGLLGVDWAPEDKKPRAVMMANVWMTNRKLPELDPQPAEWQQAAAEVATDAAKGELYDRRGQQVCQGRYGFQQQELSRGGRQLHRWRVFRAGPSFALALLSPWLQASGGGMSQFKLSRG